MSQPNQAVAEVPPSKRPRDTPSQLRLLSGAAVAVCTIFALIGVITFAGLAYALDRAKANTEQLIRVQKIQTNLLRADATATNAFLVGGLEPEDQRAAYDQALTETTTLIAEAAEAQPADATALAALNTEVVDYAAAIEQARANNRQGFPVGAQYLRNASAELRASTIPIVANLVSQNDSRAQDEMNSRQRAFFVIFGLLTVLAVAAVMVWVARRFKRSLNVGLVAATALTLITLVAGLIGLSGVSSYIDGVDAGSFDSVRNAADARIEANNAKSNESLTLIARGSGSAFEKAWVASGQGVSAGLNELPPDASARLAPLWDGYSSTHQQIRQLDDDGNWDGAVALAIGSQDNSSNMTFGAFDDSLAEYLTTVSDRTATELSKPRGGLVAGAILTFLAGIAAALLARWGIAARLKEYR